MPDDSKPSSETTQAQDAWGQDLGCPQCGYNLRGLIGTIVDCPECGTHCDLCQLATERWDKPWYRAPRFNLIALPAAWVLISVLVIAVIFAVFDSGHAWLGVVLTIGLGVCGWAGLLALVWRYVGQWTGVFFALIAHVSFVLYMSAIVACLVGVMGLFTAWDQSHWEPAVLILLAFGAFAGLGIVGRLLEKATAKHCIRLHLKRRATS